MHTLAQLKSGELSGVKRLQIADNLTEFPVEIFSLADTLEILDLSNNQLNSLPAGFGRLHQLKILFLSNNQFKQIPKILADCVHLDTIGFKANQISTVSESAFPQHTRWLILTDNQIKKLPDSIGDLPRLQKLMLAGNKLTSLPETLAKCTNLQLMRISANQLTCLPDWLLEMPKLAWLAFAGNHFSRYSESDTGAHEVKLSDIQLHEQLGEGASGVIYRAKWINRPENMHALEEQIAVKIFKGEVTSDGYPTDELQASLTAGNHPNLVKLEAQLSEADPLGLVMGLIPSRFYNLGLPPTFETCTRDTFDASIQLALTDITDIAISVADTLDHLHEKGICHGDLYAHNILVDPDATVLLGDFGAASSFATLSIEQIKALQTFEIRAYGYLLDDLLMLCCDKAGNQHLFEQLSGLKNACIQLDVKVNRSFFQIKKELQKYKAA